jgi:hypothetical protein
VLEASKEINTIVPDVRERSAASAKLIVDRLSLIISTLDPEEAGGARLAAAKALVFAGS